MSQMLYKPYQMKLLSLIKIDRDLDDVLEHMTIEEAFRKMKDSE